MKGEATKRYPSLPDRAEKSERPGHKERMK